MGPDLSKMSDEELFERLGQIHARIGYAETLSNGGMLMNQLHGMLEEVNFAIQDRIERNAMEQKLAARPAVVDLDGPQEKKKAVDTNSRAKSKSAIISRLKRSSTPSNLKDA